MIRAHVTERYFNDCVDIYIVNHVDGNLSILRMTDNANALLWDDAGHESEARSRDDARPTLSLPHDSGRALLQALVEHYQGAEDTRALRRDYDAERKRVDEHAATIKDIARTLAERTLH